MFLMFFYVFAGGDCGSMNLLVELLDGKGTGKIQKHENNEKHTKRDEKHEKGETAKENKCFGCFSCFCFTFCMFAMFLQEATLAPGTSVWTC